MPDPRWEAHLANAATESTDDDQAIGDIPTRYAYYVDSGHPELLESLLTEDCEAEHVQWHVHSFGRDDAIEHYRRLARSRTGEDVRRDSRHAISNTLVRKSPSGDEAVSTSYFTTTHVLERGGQAYLQLLGGYYTFKVRKIQGHWRVYYFKVDRTFDVEIPGANLRGSAYPVEYRIDK